MTFTAKQIADFLRGEVIGNPNATVSSFSKIEEGKPGTLTFLGNPKYTPHIYDTAADIVLVNNDFVPDKPVRATMIKVTNPYAALASLMSLVEQQQPVKEGVAAVAYISPSATVGEHIYLGEFAFIGEQTQIGNNCMIYPQVYVGDNVQLGDNCILYPGVKIYHDCVIGNNCIIHAGAVIGADGFGFSKEEEIYRKIPQIGNVIIEDDVEIGANTTIDRAVMGSTLIHRGVKLDNLIQIAHNCEVGENTVMAAQVGIAGSTKIEENCVLGGQVGIGGHITIGKKSQIGAQSGIISNTKEGSEVLGSPAIPVRDFFKSSVIFPKIPDMYRRLNAMEKELADLKKKLSEKEPESEMGNE